MSKRAYSFVAISLIIANVASAGYVDLATPGNSVNLTVSIPDNAVNWDLPPAFFTLNDASYAPVFINGNGGDMMFGIGLHDKESAINLASGPVGPEFSYQQLALSFFKFSTGSQVFPAGTLTVTIGNLHSTETAQITGFIFTGPTAAANESAWDVIYGSAGGTLTFTNTADITVTQANSVWLYGQFTVGAVPEPSSFSLLASFAAAAGALTRRRHRG